MIFIHLFLALTAVGPVAFADKKICDQVLIKDGNVSLDANEKILACGSPKGGEAWKSVPLAQSEQYLRAHLQNRGYPSPSFERHGNQLWVWAGPKLIVKSLRVEPPSEVIDPSRKRRVIGQAMSSQVLDDTSSWADSQLRFNGYACPNVDVKGQVWDQAVVVNARPGKKMIARSLDWRGRDSLESGVLNRYSAIELGKTYDMRKSQLTMARLFTDGLFEMANIHVVCEDTNADLRLNTSVGKPRLVTFGFGASTEELVFVDIGFRNSRLDNRASSLGALLHASSREQNLTVGTELYSFQPWPLIFWGPRFKVGREYERDYEFVQAKGGADLGRHWDQWDTRWFLRGGPTFNYLNTVSGLGPRDSKYLSWEGSLNGASHRYEYNLRDQSQGWTGRIEYHGQRSDIGSYINVDRFDVWGKYLWNIKNYFPPLFILATRVQGVAVNANPLDLRDKRDLLPVEYRAFWGGDQNLRGFARKRLNNSGLGYLSAAYVGFELRLVEELPYSLQPFLLFDIAKLGQRRLTLDEPLFLSWGLGLRWASPLGTVRASAAKGEISASDASALAYEQEWVYFLSFGQEF